MRLPAALLGLLLCGNLRSAEPQVELVRLPAGRVQPVTAVEASGTVHLAWLEGDPAASDVFHQTWTNGLASGSTPLRVNEVPGTAIALGTVRGARISIGRRGRVHAVWNGSRAAETSSHDGAPLLYTRLNDAGTAFEPARDLRGGTVLLDGGAAVTSDPSGRVMVVWHASPRREGATEKDRRVYVARSLDDGATFSPAKILTPDGGVCGCCGLGAISDPEGRLSVLYRAAAVSPGRPMILLDSPAPGSPIQRLLTDPWPVESCPMSLPSMIQGGADRILAAWETEGQIRFESFADGRLLLKQPKTVSDAPRSRHPALAVNRKGEVLCAWAEGTGWQRGGQVAWRTLTPSGEPLGAVHRQEGLPAWSFPAALARPDGTFVIVY